VTAPVVVVVWRRPETTARVLAAVRAAGPRRLLIVADGPRPDQAGDRAGCETVRQLIDRIDWCDVEVLAAERNLGLKRRVETGLDWAFRHVDRAIVLEDDCVPHPEFFPYCDALLERYLDEPRVLSIAGSRLLPWNGAAPPSYTFSRYPLIWGWATWRRAWRLYDPGLTGWPALRDDGWLGRLLGDDRAAVYWTHIFQREYEAPHNWDYAWTLTCWRHGGLATVPRVNLVSNVGFGQAASHTTDPRDWRANRSAHPIGFPLVHPVGVARDPVTDGALERAAFSGELSRLVARIQAHRRKV
jgi:hypothetical protein